MDQDQKPEHGDLTVGLSGKGGRGGLPAGLFFLVGLKLLCRSELAMAVDQSTLIVTDTAPSRVGPRRYLCSSLSGRPLEKLLGVMTRYLAAVEQTQGRLFGTCLLYTSDAADE